MPKFEVLEVAKRQMMNKVRPKRVFPFSIAKRKKSFFFTIKTMR
jgi:hypothetical protein